MNFIDQKREEELTAKKADPGWRWHRFTFLGFVFLFVLKLCDMLGTWLFDFLEALK